MKDYFVSNTDPFIKNVIRNIVKKNNNEIVETYNLENWKECVCNKFIYFIKNINFFIN